MEDRLLQIIAQAGVLLMAAGAAIGSLVVAVASYLNSARLRQLASAANVGIVDTQLRADLEVRLARAISKKLNRASAGFTDHYTDASRAHRWFFILGSLCGLAATAGIVTSAVIGTVLPQMAELAADSVIAYQYGLKAFMSDLSSNLVVVVVSCIGIAGVVYVVLYLFVRMHVVWKLERTKTAPEPRSVNRYDVALSTVGVVFPLSILIYICAMFYYGGIWRGFTETISSEYSKLADAETPESSIAQILRYDRHDEAAKKLAVASLLHVFLQKQQREGDAEGREAKGVWRAAGNISKAHRDQLIALDVFKDQDRYASLDAERTKSGLDELLSNFSNSNDDTSDDHEDTKTTASKPSSL